MAQINGDELASHTGGDPLGLLHVLALEGGIVTQVTVTGRSTASRRVALKATTVYDLGRITIEGEIDENGELLLARPEGESIGRRPSTPSQ